MKIKYEQTWFACSYFFCAQNTQKCKYMFALYIYFEQNGAVIAAINLVMNFGRNELVTRGIGGDEVINAPSGIVFPSFS